MIFNGGKKKLEFCKSEDFDAEKFVENEFIPFLKNKLSLSTEDLFDDAQLFKIANADDLDNSQDKMDTQETLEDELIDFNDDDEISCLYFVLKQV